MRIYQWNKTKATPTEHYKKLRSQEIATVYKSIKIKPNKKEMSTQERPEMKRTFNEPSLITIHTQARQNEINIQRIKRTAKENTRQGSKINTWKTQTITKPKRQYEDMKK